MKNQEKHTLSEKMKSFNNSDYSNILLLALIVIGSLFAIWTFTGKWPWVEQPYNSYILQAKAWLDGRLDLGQNYTHLELAVYEGKYFVSFPPFPSMLVFPFVIFGWDTCDGFLSVVAAVFAAAYAYKIMKYFKIDDNRAVMYSLLITIGSNWFFTAQVAWVWFFAQTLAFTFSLMALYYALKDKLGLSLLFWACAVGCRPLQAFYLPVILYLAYTSYSKENPNASLKYIIKKKWTAVIPMAAVALSYMLLNFMRFGNPLEFGHNYLPEFTRVEHGQFSIVYVGDNLAKLFRFPEISFKKAWKYQSFDGFLFMIASPVFWTYIVYTIRSFIRDKDQNDKFLTIIIFAMIALELILTSAHKTMGGAHFGNRYTNDVIPLVCLGIASVTHEKKDWEKFNLVLIFMGVIVNVLGAAGMFIK